MFLEGASQLVDVDLARVDVVSQGILVQRKGESLNNIGCKQRCWK